MTLSAVPRRVLRSDLYASRQSCRRIDYTRVQLELTKSLTGPDDRLPIRAADRPRARTPLSAASASRTSVCSPRSRSAVPGVTASSLSCFYPLGGGRHYTQRIANLSRPFSTSPTSMAAIKIDGTAIAKKIRAGLHEEIHDRQKLNPKYKPSLKIIQGMFA